MPIDVIRFGYYIKNRLIILDLSAKISDLLIIYVYCYFFINYGSILDA